MAGSIIPTPLHFIKNFLQKFPGFTPIQQWVLAGLILSLFFIHKRASLASMAKNAGLAYNDARYFLVRSKWQSVEQLNQVRLDTICAHKGTAPKKDGVNVFDDSGCPKRYAKKMEGVAKQYCGVTKEVEQCLVAVFAAYADADKHFPIFCQPYRVADDFELGEADSRFKSKIAIVMEFIHAIDKDYRFPTTDVADSWYAAGKIIELEDSLNRTFISELKSDRTFLFYRPDTKRAEYIAQDELVKLVKSYYPHKLQGLERTNKDGETRRVWLFEFPTNLHNCKVPLKAVLILGRLFEEDKEPSVRILFSTKLTMSAKEIVATYDLRWGVEVCFRQLKDTFYFDHFQLHTIPHIEHFWFLVLMAWTTAYCCKQMGLLVKVVQIEGDSIAAHAEALRNLIQFSSQRKMSKNNSDVTYYGIISQRAQKRAA